MTLAFERDWVAFLGSLHFDEGQRWVIAHEMDLHDEVEAGLRSLDEIRAQAQAWFHELQGYSVNPN